MNKLITSTLLLLCAGTAFSQAATIFSPSGSELTGTGVNTITFSGIGESVSTASATVGAITLSVTTGSSGKWWYANGRGDWGATFSWTNGATLSLLSTATGLSTDSISSYVVCGVNNGFGGTTMTYTFSGLTAGSTYSIALVIYSGPAANVGTFSMTTTSGVTINSYSYGYSNSGGSITTVTDNITASSLVSSVTAVSDTSSTSNTLTVVVLDITLDESTSVSFQTTNKGGFALASIAAVPEPSSFGLLAGLGALALVAARRRRRRVAPAGICA